MKLAELLDMTRVLVQNEGMADGTLTQFLNVAQDDVANDLRAPRQVAFYENVVNVGMFGWPTDARADGILKVYSLELDEEGEVMSSREIPVYDFDTASALEPGWTHLEPGPRARFIVWDPGGEIGTPVPVPNPSVEHPQSFRVNYVIRPRKMLDMDDEPFHGKLESFHDVLAYRAAFLMTGNQAMMMEFERRMRKARASDPIDLKAIRNPLYHDMMGTRSGR